MLVGKDSTVAFDEVGHSSDAKKQLEGFYIGDLAQVGIARSTIHWIIRAQLILQEDTKEHNVKSHVPAAKVRGTNRALQIRLTDSVTRTA